MKRNQNILLGILLGLIWPFSTTAAEEEGTADLASAITSGKATVSGRYRYENVDEDNALKDANASTLRLRLNYRTSQWNGWSAFAEFDHVFHVLVDDFNSGGGTSPNRSEYSIVADPEGSDLNQMYFDLDPNDNWKYRFGRQRILLDNQRFVGGVGWRQNEQTYDALTLNTKAISNTALSYSYVNNVRRIFGQSVSGGKARLDGHLFNAKINVSDSFAVTPYLYYLDYASALANSTATAGVRLGGNVNVGDGKIVLLTEFATQSDAGDNPVSYDADYFHLTAAWAMENGLSLGIAFESLGSDSSAGTAFRTPLATLHIFNGWADVFVPAGTPVAGLEDLYATVAFKAGQWNLTGVYHDFSAASGSGDYGSEFDFSAARSLGERYGVLFKGAFFSSDSTSYVDKNIIWIMLTTSY
ncbi:MAG: alginate export family protein [Gammaproteobacteria bacterium]|nr:alginate export family protein [Gammaproteobacteria bacterium]